MSTIASLNVWLRAKTGLFDRAMGRSGRQVRHFAASAESAGRRLAAFGGILAGAAFGGGLAYAVKSQMDAIDTIGKLAERTGISTEALSAWGHAAELAGASGESLHKGLQFMTKSLGEAAMGIGEGQQAIAALGLSVEGMVAAGPEESFRRIAERIRELPDPTAKAAVAMKLFGRGGIELLNLLSGNLADAEAHARRLGITFSEVDYRQVAAANDAITDLKGALRGAVNRLAVEMSPVIQALAEGLTEVGIKGGAAGSLIGEAFASAAVHIAYVADTVYSLTAAWKIMRVGLLTIAKATTLDEQARRTIGQDRSEAIRWLNEWRANKDPAETALRKLMIESETKRNRMEWELRRKGRDGAAAPGLAVGFQAADEPALRDALAQMQGFLDEHNRMVEEGGRVWERTRTPWERYQIEFKRLGGMLEDGAIDWDTYARAVDQAAAAMKGAGQAAGRAEVFGGGQLDLRAMAAATVPGLDAGADVDKKALDEARKQTELQKRMVGELAKRGGLN